jgi:hypothetical protein
MVYRQYVEDLICNYINYITKLEFLLVFRAVYRDSTIEKNICTGFRGTSLVLYNPETVLSKLDIKLRTLSLPAAEETY